MVTSTVQSAIITVLMVIINPLVIIMRTHVQKMLIEKFRYQIQVIHCLSAKLILTLMAD